MGAIHRPLIACPNCDTLHERLDPGPRGLAACRCCGSTLYRRGRLSLTQWVALAWTALIVFALAQGFPIARVSVQGMDVTVTWWGAMRLCWDRGYYGVSVMAGLFGFWFPLLQICLTLWVLQAIAGRRLPPDLGWTLRLLGRLTPWSMASVLVLSILVSIVKLAGMAHLQVQPGIFGFFVLVFFLAGLARWNVRNLWRHAEDAGMVPMSGAAGMGAVCRHCACVQAMPASGRCMRCNGRLRSRRHGDPMQVWALLLAAIILYMPANLLPMMRVQTITGTSDHTIVGGVIELWRLGSWDLSLIVFVASVLVPITKILALSFLQLSALHDHSSRRPQILRTRLYELLEFIGQWSMLDVFVVVLMAAMADFPGLSRISVGPAAFSFGAVVILTMWAAMRYDPRLGWDAWHLAQKENHVGG